MSFADIHIKTATTPINFITCQNEDGQDCYYIIMATHEKMRLLNSITTGFFNISDYGVILASGYGTEPTQEVISNLEQKYNYKFNEHDSLVSN
jgi:hypothetical protein